MSDANKTLVRRFIEEAVNKGNLNVVDETHTSDCVYREPTVGEVRGFSAQKELISMYRKAFPDIKLTIEEQVSEGNTVVTRFTGTGTQRGELFGNAATGRSARVPGVIVTHITDGKISEHLEIYDVFGMMKQLGVITAAVAKAA